MEVSRKDSKLSSPTLNLVTHAFMNFEFNTFSLVGGIRDTLHERNSLSEREVIENFADDKFSALYLLREQFQHILRKRFIIKYTWGTCVLISSSTFTCARRTWKRATHKPIFIRLDKSSQSAAKNLRKYRVKRQIYEYDDRRKFNFLFKLNEQRKRRDSNKKNLMVAKRNRRLRYPFYARLLPFETVQIRML